MEDKCMKSSLIKITKTAVALIAIVAAGGLLVGTFHSETATAQDTTMSEICSNATLRGDYAFRVSGEIFSSGSTIAVYRDGVAMTHFDGMGGLHQQDWIMGNGTENPPSGVFPGSETGTYTVNPDCTGDATIGSPIHLPEIKLKFVLADNGRVIHTIVYSLTTPLGKLPANIHSDAEKL
jgi:hypothetical protein